MVEKLNRKRTEERPSDASSKATVISILKEIKGDKFDENEIQTTRITREEFINWYEKTRWFEEGHELQKTDREEELNEIWDWPDTWCARINYIYVFPLMFLFHYTMPDVRRPRWKNWYLFSCITAILWIAGSSYMMVWWATILGETAQIPSEVMGLTILAAGTSVPDLLTSVCVA